MDKFACLLVSDNEHFKEVMSEFDNSGIERGLIASLDTDLFDKLTSMFNNLATKGYHVNGFILDKNKKIEFIFSRDKNQKTKLKEAEIINKYEL